MELGLLDGDTDGGAWLLAVSAVLGQAAEAEAGEDPVDATLQALLNGIADGQADLWLGTRVDPDGSDRGRASLFYGPLAGTRDLREADASVGGVVEGEVLGQLLAAPGDLDGDGAADLLVWRAPAGVPEVDVVSGGVW